MKAVSTRLMIPVGYSLTGTLAWMGHGNGKPICRQTYLPTPVRQASTIFKRLIARSTIFLPGAQQFVLDGRGLQQKLPRAKLALYGVIVPEGQGRSGGQLFEARMRGYRRAATLGLFDEVDYLTPVLYTKWGPDDNCGAEYRLRYCSIAARTRMGIALSSGLVNKPLVPLLSLKVFNQGSQNKSEDLPIEVARSQLAYLQSRAEVARIVYWVPPRPDNPKNLYNSALEILSFFNLLKLCGR